VLKCSADALPLNIFESTYIQKQKGKTNGAARILHDAIHQRGKQEPLCGPYLDVIDRSGLSYQLTPMGTIIEGDWDEVIAVVTDCFKALEGDCPRISTQIKIDYRAGANSRMKSKMEAVETILGRKLST